MSTKRVIEAYFDALKQRRDWSQALREDMTFVSHVVPQKRVQGRAAFMESTRRFYSMIADVELTTLLIDGDRGCALTRYRLQSPTGPSFTTEVAEIFAVADDQISSLEIYFDSSPFPK